MKKLVREFGLLEITSIACGAMLSGVFVLPGYAIDMGGPSAYLAFLLAGLLFLPSALSKAEMSTALPESGGAYVFIDRAFGPWVSTVTGFGTWLTLVMKSAFALVGMSAYLLILVPLDTSYSPYLACLVALMLIVLNCFSAGKSGMLQSVLVILTISTLVLVVERGLLQLRSDYFVPFTRGGAWSFVEATAFVFVSYAGVTKIASTAEEIKHPGRNIPRGIIISLLLMTFLSTAVSLVVAGIIPSELLGKHAPINYQNAPLAQTAFRMGGDIALWIVSVVGLIALISMANAGILSSSRFPFAMSRYRQLPEYFSTVDRRFSTPIPSTVLTGVVLLASILFFPVIQLAKLASVFLLVVFGVMNAAVIVFREGEIEWYNPEFKSPLYPYLQVIGAITSVILIPFLGINSILSAGAMIGVGSVWYFLYVRPRVDRTSTLRRDRFDSSDRPTFTKSEREIIQQNYPKPIALIPFFNLNTRQVLEAQDRIEKCVELFRHAHRLKVINFHEVSGASIQGVSEDYNETDRALDRYVSRLQRHGSFKIDFDRVTTTYSHEMVKQFVDENPVNWVVLRWKDRFVTGRFFGHGTDWFNDFDSNVILVKTGTVSSTVRIRSLVQPLPDAEQTYLIETANKLSESSGGEIVVDFCVKNDFENKHRLGLLGDYFKNLSTRTLNFGERIPPINLQKRLVEYEPGDSVLVDREGASEVQNIDDNELSATVLHPIQPQDTSFDSETHKIAEALSPDRIRLRATDIYTKRALFHEISRFTADETTPTNEVENGFWDTEKCYSTNVGNGVCVPHSLTDEGALKVSLVTTTHALEYSGSEPEIRICLGIVGPESRSGEVFRLVSKIERVLGKETVRRSILNAEDETEVLALFREHSQGFAVL